MKIYQSKAWLRDKYVLKKMDIRDIAKLANCSHQTIQNYLQKFGLIRNGRSWAGKK